MNLALSQSETTPFGFTENRAHHWREMFYQLLQVEASSGVLAGAHAVVTSALSRIPEPPLLASDNGDPLEKLCSLSLRDNTVVLKDLRQVVDLIRFHAPQALLEGCWLESVSQAATCHDEVHAFLFHIYSSLAGVGKARALAELYSALLVELGIPLPPIHTWAFATHAALPETALAPAVVQLSLARFPHDFFPETLGFTLAHCIAPAPANGLLSSKVLEKWGIPLTYFKLWERLQAENAIHAKDAARLYLRRFSSVGEGSEAWRRMQRGFQLHQAMQRDGSRHSGMECRVVGVDLCVRPVQGNHRGLPLRMPATPAGMTKRENTPAETMRAQGFSSSRDLFYQLLNIDQFPVVLPKAKERVQKTLRKAERTLRWTRDPYKRFFTYDPAAFESRITAIHDREVTGYRPLEPPPRLTREEYIWGIEQFAPLILVDGCWLQRIAQAGRRQDPIHRRLFRIYADEVGNGDPRRNHANVYRCLLDSLNIQLPPIDSRAFAQNPRFPDAAFDLPVYLLAISQLPETFLPEILGLNLAIELSGLGRVYKRLIDELTYWGIDARIVRLHLYIDNLASGHSAIAKEAIEAYLDGVMSLGGEEQQQHWRRIWTGYLSLQSAAGRFKWVLAFAFLRRFLPGRLIRR